MVGLDEEGNYNNRMPLSLFRGDFHRGCLRDYRYTTLAIIGSLAQAIDTKIVVWVQQPSRPTTSSSIKKIGCITQFCPLQANPRSHKAVCVYDAGVGHI